MRPTEKQSQTPDTQSTEQQSQQEKQLTLEELASITGGAARPLMSVKVEDSGGNKGEAG